MCTRVRVLHLYLKYTICLRYSVNNNTCLMGDAILLIPRDARVRAYCAWDTYDGVDSATSKRQLSCQSSLYTSVESMCYQTGIGATGIFIVTSAQRSRNGTMKHEAVQHSASFDVKLPNSIYSDYVISVFSYIIRFSLFLGIAYMI